MSEKSQVGLYVLLGLGALLVVLVIVIVVLHRNSAMDPVQSPTSVLLTTIGPVLSVSQMAVEAANPGPPVPRPQVAPNPSPAPAVKTGPGGCLPFNSSCMMPWGGAGGGFQTPERTGNVVTPGKLASFVFVSASRGADTNRGDSPATAVKTLGRAVAVAGKGANVGIVLLDPIHELTEPLDISGIDGRLVFLSHPRAVLWGCPVPPAANAPVLPQISGAANVTLRFGPPNAQGVVQSNIKSLGIPDLRVCWSDGVRSPRVRTGFLKVPTEPGGFDCPNFGLGAPAAGEVLIADQWSYSRNKITIPANGGRVSTDTDLIMERPRMMPSVVWIEGHPSFFKLKGQHYYNPQTGDFMYLPRPDQKRSTEITFSFPRIDKPTIIRIRNCKRVVFDSVRISHASWEFGNRLMAQQANVTKDWDMFPACIEVENSSHVAFVNCVLDQLGGASAVWFKAGCSNCAVFHSVVRDVGGSGIVIGQVKDKGGPGAEGNTVEFCDISQIGEEHPSCVGIFLGYVANTILSQNSIHSVAYSGISIGWGWGDGSDKHRANMVLRNDVFAYGTLLTDCGAVYCLSDQGNGRWEQNYAHDAVMGHPNIAHKGRIAFSFYADNGTTNLSWKNNLTGPMPKQPLEHEFVQRIAQPFATVNKEPKTMSDAEIVAGAGAKGLLVA